MGDCRNQPGDRIRQVEDKKAAVPLEYGKYPQYTQPAGSGKGDDHGDNGIIQASHASHQYVHQAAEKINRADDLHTHQAVPDNFRIGRIDQQQTSASQVIRILLIRSFLSAPRFWLVKLKHAW